MAGVNRQINPSSIAPPAANYAHAVLERTADALVAHVRGRADGARRDDPRRRRGPGGAWCGRTSPRCSTRPAWSPADIVSVTTYVVVGEPLADVMAARDEFLGGHRAASTLVTVPELARPQWRMEVAIVAAT